MTRTEERLRDALRASATRVDDTKLSSLPPPATQPAGIGRARRSKRPSTRRAGSRGWAAPLGAAVSVALVAAAIIGIGSRVHHPPAQGSFVGAAPGGLPRFYAALLSGHKQDMDDVGVYATGTGALVADIQPPETPLPPGTGPSAPPSSSATPNPNANLMEATAVATADDRTFYVVYQVQTKGPPGPFVVESFTVSDAGQPSPLRQVRGGVLNHPGSTPFGAVFAAVSGTGKLAIALGLASTWQVPFTMLGGEIIVIDTRTGVQRTWHGGLDRSGAVLGVGDLSWTADGSSLGFLATWCTPADTWMGETDSCLNYNRDPHARQSAQLREIDTAGPGGLLSASRVLLTNPGRNGHLQQALLSPDGASATVVVLTGPDLVAPHDPGVFGPEQITVERVALTTGAVLSVPYRAHDPEALTSVLSADSSGKYLIIGHLGGALGWIGSGRLHPLPHGGLAVKAAW